MLWRVLIVVVLLMWGLVLVVQGVSARLVTSTIAYSIGGDIYLDDLRTRQTRPLVQHRALDTFPAWSPDGARLAFISSRDPFADYSLFVLDIFSGELEQIARMDRYRPQPYDPVGAPLWSPTGTHIAVPVGSAISVIDLRSDDVTTIGDMRTPTLHARWHPDGDVLLVLASGTARRPPAWTFLRADIATGEITRWRAFDLGCDAMTKPVAWSPDGAQLAYICQKQVRVYDVRTGAARTVVTGGAFPDALHWSPDGTRLLYTDFFVRHRNGLRAGALVVDVATGRVQRGRAHPVDNPVWMP